MPKKTLKLAKSLLKHHPSGILFVDSKKRPQDTRGVKGKFTQEQASYFPKEEKLLAQAMLDHPDLLLAYHPGWDKYIVFDVDRAGFKPSEEVLKKSVQVPTSRSGGVHYIFNYHTDKHWPHKWLFTHGDIRQGGFVGKVRKKNLAAIHHPSEHVAAMKKLRKKDVVDDDFLLANFKLVGNQRKTVTKKRVVTEGGGKKGILVKESVRSHKPVDWRLIGARVESFRKMKDLSEVEKAKRVNCGGRNNAYFGLCSDLHKVVEGKEYKPFKKKAKKYLDKIKDWAKEVGLDKTEINGSYASAEKNAKEQMEARSKKECDQDSAVVRDSKKSLKQKFELFDKTKGWLPDNIQVAADTAGCRLESKERLRCSGHAENSIVFPSGDLEEDSDKNIQALMGTLRAHVHQVHDVMMPNQSFKPSLLALFKTLRHFPFRDEFMVPMFKEVTKHKMDKGVREDDFITGLDDLFELGYDTEDTPIEVVRAASRIYLTSIVAWCCDPTFDPVFQLNLAMFGRRNSGKSLGLPGGLFPDRYRKDCTLQNFVWTNDMIDNVTTTLGYADIDLAEGAGLKDNLDMLKAMFGMPFSRTRRKYGQNPRNELRSGVTRITTNHRDFFLRDEALWRRFAALICEKRKGLPIHLWLKEGDRNLEYLKNAMLYYRKFGVPDWTEELTDINTAFVWPMCREPGGSQMLRTYLNNIVDYGVPMEKIYDWVESDSEEKKYRKLELVDADAEKYTDLVVSNGNDYTLKPVKSEDFRRRINLEYGERHSDITQNRFKHAKKELGLVDDMMRVTGLDSPSNHVVIRDATSLNGGRLGEKVWVSWQDFPKEVL